MTNGSKVKQLGTLCTPQKNNVSSSSWSRNWCATIHICRNRDLYIYQEKQEYIC